MKCIFSGMDCDGCKECQSNTVDICILNGFKCNKCGECEIIERC